jgi:hypothetical protein
VASGVAADGPLVEGGGNAAEPAWPPAGPSLAGQRVRLAPPEFGTAGAYSLLVVAGLVLLAVTQLYRTMTNRRTEVGSA